MLYLDYSATTPVDPRVLERYGEVVAQFSGNPNSDHPLGQAANAELSRITESVAGLLAAKPSEIIYTSGASEANNTAIFGIAKASRHLGRHIISTPLEHASVSGPLTELQEQGWEVDLVRITRDGTVDLEDLRDLLRKDTVLVAVCAVDSELGTVQPIREIAALLKDFPNCRLHMDATQAVGKIPFDFPYADTVSLSAHKFYGLKSSGLLLKREDFALPPLIHGGASTTIYRSGTPDVPMAAALETALALSVAHLEERRAAVYKKNALLRETLSRYPKVRINSPENAIPHILNVSVQGVTGDDFQKALSERNVCVSVKSACSVKGTPSRAVYAVSRDRKNARCSWRISLSHLTTDAEQQEFLRIFDTCYHALAEGTI